MHDFAHNWPYANKPVASHFDFVRGYFTVETIATKMHMHWFVRGFYLIWLANAYLDWKVATRQLYLV